ncbi:electron transport complex subunit RsxC [Kangiella spongicola]|uniref:Ion-translocating oxidoreductase complex subunit C n=1 Tax=Kangiella spongicola TaxID=796379 RepID=A0A318D578_9GAMM|nr:electron transport complex subunit RsxC [Kangiella spongicola]PXF63018.1 electron transport complex subunit RsxC [Kangiella spongicola]
MERSNFTSEIAIFEIPGGVHPEEHKLQSNQAEIRRLPLADELVINLKGQAGNRSLPVVSVGDKVLKGQMIAECDGVFSAYQHAPTSGEVIAIEKRTIAHPSGLDDLCIVIKPDGEDTWAELSPVENLEDLSGKELSGKELSREKILAQIFEKGIVGLGGASFPSHIKLKQKDNIHTLIINAAECEPYITCDDKLLQEHAEEVLKGAEIISKLYHDIKIIVGIEDNKPKAIEALDSARKSLELDSIKLGIVPTKYPSGGEKQLIQLLTGQEVPHGKLPADLGLVMHNVGTCFAIYQAIALGKPLVERLVTLTGEACQEPGNYWIPFGTPVHHLVTATGSTNPKRLIMGGPMMGYELPNDQVGIVKATNCIIMSADGELGMDKTALPCIRCGKCMDACPASLLPQQLYWHAQADEFDKAEEYDLFDCIECGACAYVCPSHIPLVQYYRYAKSTIRNNRIEKSKAEKARERHEARQERLERVKREKAERHRKAAEARKKAAAEAGKKDAKKAAVQAALARVKAKKEAQKATDDNQDGES